MRKIYIKFEPHNAPAFIHSFEGVQAFRDWYFNAYCGQRGWVDTGVTPCNSSIDTLCSALYGAYRSVNRIPAREARKFKGEIYD